MSVIVSIFFIVLFAGVHSNDEGCIFCGYKKPDVLEGAVGEFSYRKSIPVKVLSRTDIDCKHVVIPSIRCRIGHASSEINFLPLRSTSDDISEWFVNEKQRLARKTPVLKNLTSVLEALKETRPMLLAFVEPALIDGVDQLLGQVKEDWPLFNFFIVDTRVADAESHLAIGFRMNHKLEPNVFVFRQYMTGDSIVGSFYTMTLEKLRTLLQFTSHSSKIFLNPDELFNIRGRITVPKPTLVYVFMMFHPNLAHDLHMANQSVHLMKGNGVDMDFFVFNVDRNLRDINHSPEADFIVSYSVFLFGYHADAVSFQLSSVGPSNLVESLKKNTAQWKEKELDVFSGLLDQWGVAKEEATSPLTRGHLVCNITEGTAAEKTEILSTPSLPPPVESSLSFAPTLKEVPKIPSFHGIPLMTRATWLATLQSTSADGNPFQRRSPKSSSSFLSQVKVTVVIFTKSSGCSHCSNSLGQFQDFHEAVSNGQQFKRMSNTLGVTSSVHIFDCNSDMDFCLSNIGGLGFPAVVAFRSLPIRNLGHCMSNEAEASSQPRFLFHGVMMAQDLISWVSEQISSPSLIKMDESAAKSDATLVVSVLPAWSHKIPRSRERKLHFFCLTCMRFVCEQLFGSVACRIRLDEHFSSDDLKTEIRDDFVVSKVQLLRADNVSAVIMQVATPLAETMDKHGPLHSFHQPHRYELSSRTLCEDDHSRCSNLLIRFTKDHSRLPVITLSEQLLHQDQSLLPPDLPLLVALVHTSNITNDNQTFNNMLQTLGRQLYNRIVVAALDVDANEFWATRFVPADYHVPHGFSQSPPPLYRYPRFAIINRLNHVKAALYPNPDIGAKTNYSLDELFSFVDDFFKAPEKKMQFTEQF